jgi:hypothetical protein
MEGNGILHKAIIFPNYFMRNKIETEVDIQELTEEVKLTLFLKFI